MEFGIESGIGIWKVEFGSGSKWSNPLSANPTKGLVLKGLKGVKTEVKNDTFFSSKVYYFQFTQTTPT